MTIAELGALVSALDTARFTLEQAVQEEAPHAAGLGPWVAYLYEHRADVTYRVADYAVYRGAYAYLPTAWIVHYSDATETSHPVSTAAAALTRADVHHLLARDDAALCPVQAVYVRYDEDDDDRYVATVREPDGRLTDVPSLTAYTTLCAAWQGAREGDRPIS